MVITVDLNMTLIRAKEIFFSPHFGRSKQSGVDASSRMSRQLAKSLSSLSEAAISSPKRGDKYDDEEFVDLQRSLSSMLAMLDDAGDDGLQIDNGEDDQVQIPKSQIAEGLCLVFVSKVKQLGPGLDALTSFKDILDALYVKKDKPVVNRQERRKSNHAQPSQIKQESEKKSIDKRSTRGRPSKGSGNGRSRSSSRARRPTLTRGLSKRSSSKTLINSRANSITSITDSSAPTLATESSSSLGTSNKSFEAFANFDSSSDLSLSPGSHSKKVLRVFESDPFADFPDPFRDTCEYLPVEENQRSGRYPKNRS